MWNSVENRFNEMFLFIPILTWIPTSFLELTSLFLSVQELISAAEEMWIETNLKNAELISPHEWDHIGSKGGDSWPCSSENM